MNTYNSYTNYLVSNTVATDPFFIKSIIPVNSNSVLLDFINFGAIAGSTYEYSFDGNTFLGFSYSQNTSPLNITDLQNNTEYTIYIRVVGTLTATKPMTINFVAVTPYSFTSNKTVSYISCGLPTPTNQGNYRSISANDYGYILIATSTGIYYSNNYGDTFTKTNNNPCISVSINNNGYALCSTGTIMYLSYNFGITWRQITTILTKPVLVFVTQNGTSYTYDQVNTVANTGANYVYKSNNYFSTIDSSLNGLSHWRLRTLSFASNGNGLITGNGLGGYYHNNFTKRLTVLTTVGATLNNYAIGISENGRYISAGNNGSSSTCHFYDFGIDPSYSSTPNFPSYSSTPFFTIKHIVSGTTTATFTSLAPIGNNGICYISKDAAGIPPNSITCNLYKYNFNTNVFTNLNIPTMVGNYNSLINTSPSGNYAVACSYNTYLYILAP